MQSDQLARTNLNDAVEGAVREMIVDGVLEAGARLNEVHLAERLGVSRTPLREALNRLAAEGAVEARPRFGYFVAPLTLEDFEHSYDIRPVLDPEALRMAGLPPPTRIEALEHLNAELWRTKSAVARIALDDAWHLALIDHCPNRVLLGLIRTMMVRTRRYELVWARAHDASAVVEDGHARILNELRSDNLAGACAALRDNLSCAKPTIAAWLKARISGEDGASS